MSVDALMCLMMGCVSKGKKNAENYMDEIEKHLDKVYNVETDDDCIHALRHCTRTAMFLATKEYRKGWAGIIELGTIINDEKLKIDLRGYISPIVHLLPHICAKFNVAHPASKETPEGKISFRQWYRQACEKAGFEDDYPEFIFELIPKTLDNKDHGKE